MSRSSTKEKKRKTTEVKNTPQAAPQAACDAHSKNRLALSETDTQVENQSKPEPTLAYVVLSKDECEQILSLNVQAIESKLQEKFQLQPETNLKDAAILDYYVGATHWGQQQSYSPQQISILLTIVHTLLNNMKDNQLALAGLVIELKNMMATVCHRQDQTLGGNIFTTLQSKAITSYLFSNLFQHYRLYDFLFSMPQDEEIITTDLSIEVPIADDVSFPKSLDEGLPEEILMTQVSASESPQEPVVSEDPQVEVNRLDTPVEIDLPPEARNIFDKLTPEEIKVIISDACAAVLNNLESQVENKIIKQEAATLANITKLQARPSSSKFPQDDH